MDVFKLEEASIEYINQALSDGVITSVELTTMYLNRIYFYDQNTLCLNSIPLLCSDALTEAQRMDDLRAKGIVLGPLHGIPFTVKDSYMVKGMTVSNGSPAFAHLTADRDSFMVDVIRQSGGILLGKTNMPPMAAGGMQRGLYGRAESPYNAEYLPAAWFSGSSNGSGTSTAANFAVFGMAEETVSSGRSPASNNGLVAYTPSRGLLSIRGNWPLFPTRDVVVPHTRTVSDLLTVLDVIMKEDEDTQCDFWRDQKVVELPNPSDFRAEDFNALKSTDSLQGKRIGVPKIYIGQDKREQSKINIRPSILALWERTRHALTSLGAEVVDLEFPLMDLYETDPIFLKSFVGIGWLPEGWMEQEWDYFNPYALEAFLQYVNDPNYKSWECIDPDTVFPNPLGSVDDRRGNNNARYRENIDVIKQGCKALDSLPNYNQALLGLEEARKVGFENWLSGQNIDFLAFPANCDIGQSNADINDEAYDTAWKNGNFFSNTNHMLRHLGIPSVSVCMGMMEDTQMPVNTTFIGPAYTDLSLISYAYAYEQATNYRIPGTRTPPLEGEQVVRKESYLKPTERKVENIVFEASTEIRGVNLEVEVVTEPNCDIHATVNGIKINTEYFDKLKWHGQIPLACVYRHSPVIPRTLKVIILVKNNDGSTKVKHIEIDV
ncbi:amidase [Vibrio sp. Y2-5]|uniref:amidase n=1 Tax=Vibrio sp. Y2-5 TaxID=2743977 RepID=UPI001660AC54|nr:amidase [Vibrio sp. Y2-5]MBD0788349.1 amidase [Vibrio sp. Y2-5]